MWTQFLHICTSKIDHSSCPCNPPQKRYMEAQFWQPPVSNHFLFPRLTWHSAGLPVYILRRGWRWWRWWCLIGGAGYGAKWKHVTQDPLTRNLAQQKKGTHIIIKSSQGEGKKANIIPAPPSPHPPHIRSHTPPLIFLQMTEKMGRLLLWCVCSLPVNDKMMFENFLNMPRFVCL